MISISFSLHSIPPLMDELLIALSITTVVKVPTMVCNIAVDRIDKTINTLPTEGHFELLSWASMSFMLLIVFPLILSASSSASSHNIAVLGKRLAALIRSITATTFQWIILFSMVHS